MEAARAASSNSVWVRGVREEGDVLRRLVAWLGKIRSERVCGPVLERSSQRLHVFDGPRSVVSMSGPTHGLSGRPGPNFRSGRDGGAGACGAGGVRPGRT